jgi:hypothetical protein
VKNEKNTRFFAFSPKASKSRFVQAGLLTYPPFNAFPPPKYSGNSGSLLKSYSGITAAGTVQELPLPDSPVSLLILNEKPIRPQSYTKE